LLLAVLCCVLTLGCSSPAGVGLVTVSSDAGLSRAEAQARADALWADYRAGDTAEHLAEELASLRITHGEDTMPLSVELFWDDDLPVPESGYPVYLSMHGGGAFTPGENEEQWAIQQGRYPSVQGLYICPRSARDTWDHWHERHMFALIDKLVRAVLLRDDIDPDRIYLCGYCSGGNGVYQLGPVLADRWAAVSATKAIREGGALANLRNVPIDLQWGGADPDTIDRAGFNRRDVDTLYELHDADPGGYTFRDIEHYGQGRFINDKSTVGWLSRFTRDPYPDRVVWEQNGPVRASSNPLRHTFYYLAIDPDEAFDGSGPDTITAVLDPETNSVALRVDGYDHVRLRLNDAMLDLDRPVTVRVNGRVAVRGTVVRSEATLEATLLERGDRRYMFPVELRLPVEAAARAR
jgi:hypothetical protein